AASQAPEGAAGAVAVRGGALPGQSLLPFGDALLEIGVLDEVPAIAGDRFEVGGGGVLELPGAPGQSHHGAVRLELREAHLQGLACSGEVEAIQEVDGHVRGGAEGRA